MIVNLSCGGIACQHTVDAVKIACRLQGGRGDIKGRLRVDPKGTRDRGGDVHVQDQCQICRHHKTVIAAGGQRRDQRIIIDGLPGDLELVASQGDIRVFTALPGGIFTAHRRVGISGVQGDRIFRDFQGKGFLRSVQEHGDVAQGKVGVAVIAVVQSLYGILSAGIRLYLAGSGNLVRCVGTDRQHGAHQDCGQYEDIDLLQDIFQLIFHGNSLLRNNTCFWTVPWPAGHASCQISVWNQYGSKSYCDS